MDLAPGRSFIQWAVDHGHTVFAISYRNPDQTMRGGGWTTTVQRDRPRRGPRHHRGAWPTHGLLGGTLTTMLIAYLDAIGDQRVKSATLLNTLIDFSSPGVLGTFTDRETVERLEAKMARQGYLEGREMATTFDLLRANDLYLELRGQQLADGRGPAGLRHPGLERRLDPHAGGHALVLPAHLLPWRTSWRGARWSWPGCACTWTP